MDLSLLLILRAGRESLDRSVWGIGGLREGTGEATDRTSLRCEPSLSTDCRPCIEERDGDSSRTVDVLLVFVFEKFDDLLCRSICFGRYRSGDVDATE